VLLVVYVGAIAVLFLFVVMMLNVKLTELTTSEFNYLPLNIFVMSILALEISYLIYSTFYPFNYFDSIQYVEYIQYLDSFVT
jgi:NADH-quinone oxidoreductase subunit J